MGLETYKHKRNFTQSPEPTGGKPVDKKLHFVIQKHQASHLHYDFRLELRGILKSWAVPKGPSMDTEEKRLAMMVEDHPWDYKDFEGIIPSGYGKGTVIVWDEGTYETTAITEKDKKSQEYSITSQFWKGEIKLRLHGHKVKGDFIIKRAKEKAENAWYLLKIKDKYASEKDITLKRRSVMSKQRLEEVASNPQAEWKSNRQQKVNYSSEKNNEYTKVDIKQLIKQGSKSEKPRSIKPMLCTKVDEPFDGEDWVFEIKWDGYRILAHVNNGKVALHSRKAQDYTARYPAVVEVLKKIKHNVIIDGEIVAINKNNQPDFSAIQNYRAGQPLIFYAFDIVWIDGYDITNLELLQRKYILSKILPTNDSVKLQDHVEARGIDMFAAIEKLGLEGMVAKRKDSAYIEDERSKNWLKIPHEVMKEYVIIGWTESEKGRPFARIMFGEYRNKKLYYVYHTGSSVSDKLASDTLHKLKKIEVKTKPVVNYPREDTPMHWVKPIYVGQFKEKKLDKTNSGAKRHPVIFLGTREDKDPSEIVGEGNEVQDNNSDEETTTAENTPATKTKGSPKFNALDVWEKLHPNVEIEKTDKLNVEEKEITVVNDEKEYWVGITKAGIMIYYHSMAKYILPYLKDRPLGLNIVKEWAGKGTEFVRNMKGNYPSWVKTFKTDRRVKVKDKSPDIDWVVCNDLATLFYMLSLDALDFHPWAANYKNYNYPDYLVIDLDTPDRPDEKSKGVKKEIDKKKEEDRKNLIKTALAAKQFFDKHKLIAFIKTSGKRGLHIFLPCEKIHYNNTRALVLNLTKEIHNLVPKITTIVGDTEHKDRKEKIYIDASQNDYSDRAAVVYGVRAYKIPTVSTPLEWKEINNMLNPKDFTIDTILERVKEKGDLFGGLFDKKVRASNSKSLKQFL